MLRDLQRGRLQRLLPAALAMVGVVACGGSAPSGEAPAPSSEVSTLPSGPSSVTPVTLAPSATPDAEARRPAPRVSPWYERLGGPQDDLGASVAVDGEGHLVSVWDSTPRVDGDRAPVEGERRVLSLSRHAADGQHRWTREFPRNRVTGPRVGAARDGAVLLSGNAPLYPVDFGLGEAAQDGFLVRFSAKGEPVWQRRVGQKVHGLAVDAAGDALVAGEEWTEDAHEPLLARYGADGTVRWSRHFQFPSEGTVLHAVAFTPSGYALLAGSVGGLLTVDGRTFGADGTRSLVLLAFGPEGQLAWGQEARGVDGRVTGLAVASDGGVVAVGESQGALTWGGTTLTGGGAFVLAAGVDGEPRWLRRPACGGLTSAPAVAVDAGGAVAASCGHTVSRFGTDGAPGEARVLPVGSCFSGRCSNAVTSLASVPGNGLAVTGLLRDGAAPSWNQDAFLQLLAP